MIYTNAGTATLKSSTTFNPILADFGLERRLAVLRRADFFSPLGDVVLRRMASSLVDRVFARGTTILKAEEANNGNFYIVAEGEVAVVLEGADGKETVLATLNPGEFFGEMSLLDGSPRAATVRSVKTARVMVLHRDDFSRYLADCPVLTFALLSEMNNRLRQSNRKVAGLSYRPMHARVASAVLGLMEARGIRQREPETGFFRIFIRNRPSQQFLAEMAGTTRESVSRTLAAWGRQGLVRSRGRELVILEEGRLKAMVH